MSFILSAFADEAASDLAEQIRICRTNGVQWIEMRGVNGKNVSDLTGAEAKEIRKQLDGEGFGVSSLGSPFGKIGINDDFVPHLEKFKRTIETAHILGTGYMRLFSFFMPGEDADKYENAVLERLHQFAEAAGGIVLCHENEKGIYGDVPERCLKIYNALGGKMRLIFDPANFIQSGVAIAPAYDVLRDYIAYFHIKDAFKESGKVVPAGKGDGEIAYILNRFTATGDVFLSLEPHLRIFKGFDALGDRESIGDYTYQSGEEAFAAAANALKEVLTEIGFAPKTDGGYQKWVK